jgi:hypothetical protein
VEPYGLDISPRIVSAAQHRLPHWRERLFAGDGMTWHAPRRFDVVQVGLDIKDPQRERAFVERILRDLVEPGGVLVFRAERVQQGVRDVPERLRAMALEPHGVIDAVHPRTGDIRRTAWLRAR